MPKISKAKRLTVTRNKTTPSSWVIHIRMCMEKYNLTYKQATQNGKCRNLYYLGHE